MKVINKEPIPTQECKNCGSLIAIKYRNLIYGSMALSKTDWKCPLCKTEQRVKFGNEK